MNIDIWPHRKNFKEKRMTFRNISLKSVKCKKCGHNWREIIRSKKRCPKCGNSELVSKIL